MNAINWDHPEVDKLISDKIHNRPGALTHLQIADAVSKILNRDIRPKNISKRIGSKRKTLQQKEKGSSFAVPCTTVCSDRKSNSEVVEQGIQNLQVAASSEGDSNNIFYVVVDFKDRKGSHGKQSFQFGSEDLVKTLIDEICKVKFMDQDYLLIYYNNIQILDPTQKLFNVVKSGDTVEAIHSSLNMWKYLLDNYDSAMAATGIPIRKRQAAQRADSISDKLYSNNFFIFYEKFADTWKSMKSNEQFMRMIDTTRIEMETCANQFFKKLFPGCHLKFEDKLRGSRSGVIINLYKSNELIPSFYFMKTYHLAGTSPSSSPQHFPDFREMFAYRLLNYMKIGPVVHFPYYKESTQGYFIVTEAVNKFTEMTKLIEVYDEMKENGQQVKGSAEQKLIYQLVVEAHLLSLILGLSDFNFGNFGSNKDNKLSVVDFEIGSEDVISCHNIVNKFEDNVNNCYDVQRILDKMENDEKYDIGKLALQKWNSLESASLSLIDKEREELRQQGIKVGNDTCDVNDYFLKIMKNFRMMKEYLSNV